LNEAQIAAAKASLTRAQPANGNKIVTKIEPLAKFWKAEEYHQQYAEKTGSHGCPIALPPEAT
jgi:peptide-methionine (S)-S-oxide reductase